MTFNYTSAVNLGPRYSSSAAIFQCPNQFPEDIVVYKCGTDPKNNMNVIWLDTYNGGSMKCVAADPNGNVKDAVIQSTNTRMSRANQVDKNSPKAPSFNTDKNPAIAPVQSYVDLGVPRLKR